MGRTACQGSWESNFQAPLHTASPATACRAAPGTRGRVSANPRRSVGFQSCAVLANVPRWAGFSVKPGFPPSINSRHPRHQRFLPPIRVHERRFAVSFPIRVIRGSKIVTAAPSGPDGEMVEFDHFVFPSGNAEAGMLSTRIAPIHATESRRERSVPEPSVRERGGNRGPRRCAQIKPL